MDYFISGDFLEHPYRTRLASDSDPYTEQLVLLSGQGIWYSSPNSTEFEKSFRVIENKTAAVRHFRREEFGLDPKWFIYMCPQNLFKLHVFFDDVIARILLHSISSHLVFTVPKRRKLMVEKFKKRIRSKLGGDIFMRCHFLPRVSSEQFINFIKIGDVLLHPFPFDGSRISADSITAGIPYVTLPTEYLKGRMGASFYRTMNIPDLVATDVDNYVFIAVRLSLDSAFLLKMRRLISSRAWMIFEDMEVPFAWSQFLLNAVGEKPQTWSEFIENSFDRDIVEETTKRNLRRSYQQLFDDRRVEEWLLDKRGLPVLENDVLGNLPPRIFNNWNRPEKESLALSGEDEKGKWASANPMSSHQSARFSFKMGIDEVRYCAYFAM